MKIKTPIIIALLYLFSALYSSQVSAQEFSFESDELTQQGTLGEENLFVATLTNLSDSENTIHLELDDQDFPELWDYFWCISEACLPPETTEYEISLTANATDTVFIHIFPDSVKVKGAITVTAYSLDAPDVIQSLTFTVEFDQSVGNSGSYLKPEEFTVSGAYPNPFNRSATISYSLNSAGDIDVAVFNIIGQQVKTLYKGKQTAGIYRLRWDGLDGKGIDLQSGIYFINLIYNNKIQSTRIVKVK